MAQAIQTSTISAPGFMGLNTQDSSLDLAQGFALVANNCVIDQYGRIGARKGWQPQHAVLGALSTASVKAIAQLVIDSISANPHSAASRLRRSAGFSGSSWRNFSISSVDG